MANPLERKYQVRNQLQPSGASNSILYIIVPCFNEAAVLAESNQKLIKQIKQLASQNLCCANESKILYVDDGSLDNTWQLIKDFANQTNQVRGIKLSRNKGHQNALIAGLEECVNKCDISISIDADLQDDLNVSIAMLEHFHNGYEIVYGIRNDRSSDTRSKRFFANRFYSMMLALGVEIIPGHADYRLISNRALSELLRYQERSLFLRGIIPLLGFKTASVHYARKARKAGVSKYPFRKSLSLAVDGILAFSNKPLRAIAYLGCFIAILALLGIIAIIISAVQGYTVQGWPSVMVAIFFIGGCQMLSLGIIGEYLGRLYKEQKQRPRYHLEQHAPNKKDI